jgi:hypothetical protein
MPAKKRYEEFKKKYNLPDLKNLIKEFEVKLDEPDLILHEIITKIIERVSNSAQKIEFAIFAGASGDPSSLYESKMLEDKDKTFELFKEMMSTKWRGEEVKVGANESEMAKFIKEAYDSWIKRLKPNFIDLCHLFQKEWKNASLQNTESEMMYHG